MSDYIERDLLYGTCISHYHYCPNCGAKMEDANNAER